MRKLLCALFFLLFSTSSLALKTIDVQQFGAKCDGVTDDTTSIQNAFNALGSAGNQVTFPPGNCVVSSVTISKSGLVTGVGAQTTVIYAKNGTGDVFNVIGAGVTISHIGFNTIPTRTAGAYVHFNTGGNQGLISDFYMAGNCIGVQMTAGDTVRVEQGSIRNGATGAGCAGILNDGGNDDYIDSITMDAPAGSQPPAGIQVTNTSSLQISNVDIIHQTSDLLLNPPNGNTVASVYVINSFFDTAVNGIYINPAAGGTINRCTFTNTWSSSHTGNGIYFGSTGTISGIDFSSHYAFGNTGDNVVINGGSDIKFTNLSSAGSSGNGFNVAAGVSSWQVLGGKIGNCCGFGNNAGTGILVAAGASANYSIIGVNLLGNTVAALNDGGTGTKYVSDNVGINQTSLTVDSGSQAYTASRDGSTGYLTLTGSQTTFSGYRFLTGGSYEQLRVSNTTNSVPYINITGATTGGRPVVQGAGETNTGLFITSSGTGDILLATGNTSRLQVQITDTASANRNLVLTGSNGGNPTISASAGNVAITGGVVGTATNDNAAAGVIGELITATVASGSSVSLTSTTTANITSVSLTAGDWDCSGAVDYTFGATTSITNLTQGISTTSATLGAQDTFSSEAYAAMVPTAAKDSALPTPIVRESLSATTTVFLVAQGTFTVSTLKGYGTLRCRRVR